MKRRLIDAVAAGVIATYLLLGAGATQAATVVFGDPKEPTKATGIQDLNVGGTLYDVTFNVLVTAAAVYGAYPGKFTFTTNSAANSARNAINAALNSESATAVGEAGLESDIFNIGFASLVVGSIESVKVARGINETGEWVTLGLNTWTYNVDEKTYAEFTRKGGAPPTDPQPSTSAPGFIHKSITCPKNTATLIPTSSAPITVSDITVTTNSPTNVLIRFNPPAKILMNVNMNARETVVSNFGGDVRGQEGQGLQVTCGEPATISVIIVGSGAL